MGEIIKFLSSKDIIFKGGSSLLFVYGLDRFSEDLDFDSLYPISIKSVINTLKPLNFTDANIKKDTDTTKRAILNFENNISIKLEISNRDKDIDLEDTKNLINNMRVYTINKIVNLKLDAMANRTTARDLYDIAFIVDKYDNQLSNRTKRRLASKFNYNEFMDLAIAYENTFYEDKILNESALFKSITRLSEKIPVIKKSLEIDRESKVDLKNNLKKTKSLN